MNYTKLPKKVLVLLAAPVLLTLALPSIKAQSQTETKIRLMAEALRARDSGDLATAKTNLEQLLVLAPNDVTVQRLLAGVNDALAKGAVPALEVASVPTQSTPVEVTYNPNAPTSSAEASVSTPPAPATAPAPVPVSEAAGLASAEEARVADLIAAAKSEVRVANALAKSGDFDGAMAKITSAEATLPVNTLTQDTISFLERSKANLQLAKSQALLKTGNTVASKVALDSYKASANADPKASSKQAARIEQAELSPEIQPISEANPEYLATKKNTARLITKARSQYVAGDVDGALETFRLVETQAPENPEAKYFLQRIAEDKAKIGTLNREKTRSQLLQEVANAWERPGVYLAPDSIAPVVQGDGPATLAAKLDKIIIPSISFTGVELGRVISTLSAYSEEFDPATSGPKGVNLVLSNQLPGANVPLVNITLRNLSLKRILDIITENVGYQYEIQSDLIQVRPSGDITNLRSEEFAVSKSALTRMTGIGASGTASATAAAAADPFAAAAPAATSTVASGGEADAIKRFLSAAGVNFEGVPNSNLAYDGSRIIVNQTGRNIERIRNILARYNETKQVEIEAKFMDVSEGAVEELGITWNALRNSTGTSLVLGSPTRDLGGAFTTSSASSNGSIDIPPTTTTPAYTKAIPNSPPALAGTVNLGSAMGNIAALTGASIGSFDVTATLRALSLRQGSDLLSAPKVTVLSGREANISVAQELIYPDNYSQGTTTVTPGQSNGLFSTGPTIDSKPAIPSGFKTREVGVKLTVTPTVEEDEYSINLDLNPSVTEFEGFVEYGAPSVQISNGVTVTTPSGIYQPIFTHRDIKTSVTVWDGATLVMGGLTREEVKRVNDKTPILGDIPLLGRLFKSKGEASSKRNLLIFVTANLVSPGGSLKKQGLKGVSANSVFQNPSVVTPGNSETRVRSN
jgi:general secretion pathway protein D